MFVNFTLSYSIFDIFYLLIFLDPYIFFPSKYSPVISPMIYYSPIFRPNMKALSFWIYMFGPDVGTLFVWQHQTILNKLICRFKGSQGNYWRQVWISIEGLGEFFQVNMYVFWIISKLYQKNSTNQYFCFC